MKRPAALRLLADLHGSECFSGRDYGTLAKPATADHNGGYLKSNLGKPW
jgi:hypothetical protein